MSWMKAQILALEFQFDLYIASGPKKRLFQTSKFLDPLLIRLETTGAEDIYAYGGPQGVN